MAQSTVNPARPDPYRNFTFRVKWDGRYVAGISRVGPLQEATEVVNHGEDGVPGSRRKTPGRTGHGAISLERGVTYDIEFVRWVNGARPGSHVSLEDLRKDVIIDVVNDGGQKVLSYTIRRCWASQFQALPGLEADACAVAIDRIKLENEGWECNDDVAEPRRGTKTRPTAT